jgi:ABC-type proline/glycine betaine transport system substrate-binding protein
MWQPHWVTQKYMIKKNELHVQKSFKNVQMNAED